MYNTNKNPSLVDRQQDLLRHLSERGRVKATSDEFSVISTNHGRVDFVLGLLDEFELYPDGTNSGKSNAESEKYRLKGNEMFKLKCNDKSIEYYTQSIAHAENNTESLAIAYANRSAVLFQIKLYKECLDDISRALGNPYPAHLMEKLQSRQEKALNLVSTQKNLEYHINIPTIENDNKNPLIECSSDAIEIKYSPNLGRHIVAKRDISPGEILAIEKPYCKILVDCFFNHCHNCLKLCYNLKPCPKCCTFLYCSDECEISSKNYHDIECCVSKTLQDLKLDKLKLIALRTAIISKKHYNKIWNITTDEKDVYTSGNFKEIHALIANTEKRSTPDLFERSFTSSILFYIIRKWTNFFDGADEASEAAFKEILLINLQTGPCNFHEISEITQNEDGVYAPVEIGSGSYSFLSMLNHSCTPNVLRNCYGSAIVLRCLETIREGEQCFDNYGYHYAIMVKSDRQKHLSKQYFFDCLCLACEEDWPLYEDLSLVKEGLYIPSADLEDLQLGNRRTAKKILKEHLGKLQEVEKFKPSKNLAELQEVIKQCYALNANMRSIV
ncbi:unnamed protein product [Brassicogethes aeneus]|uniref:Protein-lysine N-methyltransferase SMYD4 n=1 Tax=Brassicogethes aeneus TaxID=1431903 RepID=A0A9P0BL74_BRAAE|nr:unnamed protein product [Brassicogethes aeneus]